MQAYIVKQNLISNCFFFGHKRDSILTVYVPSLEESRANAADWEPRANIGTVPLKKLFKCYFFSRFNL